MLCYDEAKFITKYAGKAIDVADYLEIQPRSTLREHVYTADLMGLLDTQQCLLFGKNAESVEVLKSMMPSAGKKWKGYDIHMAISALDSVQNTQIADKFPCIQIFIPSRPLKK